MYTEEANGGSSHGFWHYAQQIEYLARPSRCTLQPPLGDKNCHVCWSGVGGASVACRAKVLAEMQRKDEWTEQVCGVPHFRANAEGSEMQMSCVGFWENQ